MNKAVIWITMLVLCAIFAHVMTTIIFTFVDYVEISYIPKTKRKFKSLLFLAVIQITIFSYIALWLFHLLKSS